MKMEPEDTGGRCRYSDDIFSYWCVLTPSLHGYVSIPLFLFLMNKEWDHCILFPVVGLDAGKIKQVGIICGQESTRRIGDYKVKYGYTDIDLLR
jgi:hypothetical protein